MFTDVHYFPLKLVFFVVLSLQHVFDAHLELFILNGVLLSILLKLYTVMSLWRSQAFLVLKTIVCQFSLPFKNAASSYVMLTGVALWTGSID
jgi:hypothetical protein